MDRLKRLFAIKLSKRNIILIACGCIVNIGLFILMKHFQIPLYLDTVGTAYISFLLGPTAGIITSIVTMMVQFIVIQADAVLYALISVGVALSVGLTARTKGYKNGLAVMGVIFISYLIATIISSLAPLLSKGSYHMDLYTNILYTAITEILTTRLYMEKVGAQIVASLSAGAIIRLVDTLVVSIVTFVFYMLTPKRVRYEMMGYDVEAIAAEPKSDDE